jgi:hypothetical protein
VHQFVQQALAKQRVLGRVAEVSGARGVARVNQVDHAGWPVGPAEVTLDARVDLRRAGLLAGLFAVQGGHLGGREQADLRQRRIGDPVVRMRSNPEQQGNDQRLHGLTLR